MMANNSGPEMPTIAARVAVFERGEYKRAVSAKGAPVDLEKRTVEVSFSSEALVDRGGFYEVLSHEPGAIRGARLDAGLAVLVNHEKSEHVGITENWRVDDDRRCRSVVRFGESVQASDIFRDVATGIRPGVSVRYHVHDWREETAPDGRPVFIVTDWEPMELSFESIPADVSVGPGRSADNPPAMPAGKREKNMADENTGGAPVDVRAVEDGTRQGELRRVNEIMAIGKRHGLTDLMERAIGTGMGLDEFRGAVLAELGKAPVAAPLSTELGMTNKEVKRYSVIRALNALANPQNRAMQDAAGFEFECSAAAAKQSGREPRGVLVPHDVLTAARGMTVGTVAAGGYLKGTDLMPESFIEMLRNRLMVLRMGATEMSGLVGDVAVPRQTAGATGYWVAEDGSITGSTPTLAQMSLTPRTVGAMTELSKKLLVQSTPAADNIVMRDLSGCIGTAIDLAALHGTGTNQPTGIIGVSGISLTYGGTNGGDPTYALLCAAEEAVANAAGDGGSQGWLTNPSVRKKLRQIFTNATYGSQPLWEQSRDPGEGLVLGYRAGCTPQVSRTITRGTSGAACSAMFFGDWSQVVVGLWTGLDLTIDPYSLSATGGLRVVALQIVDVNVRQPGAFAVISGLTTV